MFVEFNDKNSSRLTTFSITKGVKVVKSSEVIEVSELFFFIASRLPSEEIKLHPKRMVHLWDLTEKKWKLIYLQRDEKCVKEYDEDEADEAEDVQQPWTEEEEDDEGKDTNNSEKEREMK